jgi:uncharacterized membrane protein YjgN (DUF898 family)
MTKRSVVSVILLTCVTFGIYAIVWMVKTKNEMNTQGANIPTAWLLIVPVVSIWWSWKYAGGVEHVTRGKFSQVIAFILMAVLGVIGMAIIQDAFNKAADQGALPNARAMG